MPPHSPGELQNAHFSVVAAGKKILQQLIGFSPAATPPQTDLRRRQAEGLLAGDAHETWRRLTDADQDPLPAVDVKIDAVYHGPDTKVTQGPNVVRGVFSRRNFFAATALGAVSRYVRDVDNGMQKAEHSHPYITHELDASPEAPADTMTVVFSGLSGESAAKDARMETAFKTLGDVKAMGYDKTLNTKTMAQKIIDLAKLLGKKRVNAVGESMGGIIAIETMVEVLETSELEVPFIVLDSTPSSIDSVWPEKLGFIDWVTWVMSAVPGIEYSKDASFVGQYLAHVWSHFSEFSQQNLFENAGDAYRLYKDVNSPGAASLQLIQTEYNAIVAANMPDSLQRLGKLPTRAKPILVLFQPADVTADDTINSTKSAAEYRQFAKDANLTLLIVRVPGITHANPGFKPGEWNAGMTVQVFPAIGDLLRTKNYRADAEAAAAQLALASAASAAALATPDGQAAAPHAGDNVQSTTTAVPIPIK